MLEKACFLLFLGLAIGYLGLILSNFSGYRYKSTDSRNIPFVRLMDGILAILLFSGNFMLVLQVVEFSKGTDWGILENFIGFLKDHTSEENVDEAFVLLPRFFFLGFNFLIYYSSVSYETEAAAAKQLLLWFLFFFIVFLGIFFPLYHAHESSNEVSQDFVLKYCFGWFAGGSILSLKLFKCSRLYFTAQIIIISQATACLILSQLDFGSFYREALHVSLVTDFLPSLGVLYILTVGNRFGNERYERIGSEEGEDFDNIVGGNELHRRLIPDRAFERELGDSLSESEDGYGSLVAGKRVLKPRSSSGVEVEFYAPE